MEKARWNIRRQFIPGVHTTAHQCPRPMRVGFGTLRSPPMPAIPGFHGIATIIPFLMAKSESQMLLDNFKALCWWQHKPSQSTVILSSQARGAGGWSLPPVLLFEFWMINLSVNCETCLMFYPFPRTCLPKGNPCTEIVLWEQPWRVEHHKYKARPFCPGHIFTEEVSQNFQSKANSIFHSADGSWLNSSKNI